MKNDKICTLYLPIAYAFAWFLGFYLSTQGDWLRDVMFPSAASTPGEEIYTLFIATICVYLVFMVESFLNFIEIGIRYYNRQFTGSVFFILAGYVLHFAATFIVFLLFISSKGSEAALLFLMLIVAILKFGIVYMTNNILRWSADFKDKDYSSNI